MRYVSFKIVRLYVCCCVCIGVCMMKDVCMLVLLMWLCMCMGDSCRGESG